MLLFVLLCVGVVERERVIRREEGAKKGYMTCYSGLIPYQVLVVLAQKITRKYFLHTAVCRRLPSLWRPPHLFFAAAAHTQTGIKHTLRFLESPERDKKSFTFPVCINKKPTNFDISFLCSFTPFTIRTRYHPLSIPP
jgi:hypothetical protein